MAESVSSMIRLDKDLHERLKEHAKEQHRSLNSQIGFILGRYIASLDAKKEAAHAPAR